MSENEDDEVEGPATLLCVAFDEGRVVLTTFDVLPVRVRLEPESCFVALGSPRRRDARVVDEVTPADTATVSGFPATRISAPSTEEVVGTRREGNDST